MNIMITGASSGLGREICKQFIKTDKKHNIFGIALNNFCIDGIDCISCDLTKEEEIIKLCDEIEISELDILINCAGINIIDWIENLTPSDWESVMDINCKSIFLLSKYFLDKLQKAKGTILNIVSNAYKIPMTHSLIYNASKGAAHIMTKQMARELTKSKGITVFGVNPNKMKNTDMSNYIGKRVCELRDWDEKTAEKYQLSAITTGFETEPAWIAELIVWLLEKPHRHKYLSGCLLDLGG